MSSTTFNSTNTRKIDTKKKKPSQRTHEDKKDKVKTSPVILVLQETYHIPRVKQYTNHPEVKPSDQWRLHQIMKQADRIGVLQVEYCHAQGRSSGRLYAKGSYSLQSLSRRLRNSLAQDTHFDIDIVNCNPTLLHQLCKKNGWVAPHLETYNKNRSQTLKDISEDILCSIEDAKELFLSLINGGTYENWAAKRSIKKTSPTPFVKKFIAELKTIRKLIWDSQPQYHDSAKQKVEYKKEMGKVTAGPEATCMSYVITDIENACQQAIRQYLASINLIMSTLIFDGGLVQGHPPNTDMIHNCEDHCYKETGYRVQLVIKPMNEKLPDNPFCTLLDEFLRKKYVIHLPFHQQFVSDQNLPQFPVLLLISPPGTGKTSYITQETKKILEQDPNSAVIIPSSRIAITKQHKKYFEPLGFKHYGDDDNVASDKLITTLDSLVCDYKYRRAVTILDEIEASLQHLFGATLKNKRLPTFQKLLQITNRATRVFALDGDIGDLTLTFFRIIFDHLSAKETNEKQHNQDQINCGTEKSILVAQNSFKPSQKRIFFVNKFQWYNQLHALLQDKNSKIFMGCDSCIKAQLITERIKQ